MPVFVTVTLREPLSVPTVWLPKATAAGLKAIPGAVGGEGNAVAGEADEVRAAGRVGAEAERGALLAGGAGGRSGR
ncbi:MAG: hypothetical protein U0841_09755 [Chloroflexia bacterium]